MILIITNKEDVHPNPVIEKLGNYPFFRLNTEDLLVKYQIEWRNIGGEIRWSIYNVDNKIVVKSEEIISVWERRPEAVNKQLYRYSDRRLNKFCKDEATAFMRYLRYSLKDVFWIGHPLIDRASESRLLQLTVALECGILCADSIFSNNPMRLKEFASKYEFLCIKSIYNDSVTFDQYYVAIGSTKTPQKNILNLDDKLLATTVNYIQEYIEKDFELRITVVSNEIFACKLFSQDLDEDKGKIDWRDGLFYGLKHEAFDVPEKIKQFCFSYLKAMKQNFGAFDFIVKPNGDYVFLECNSNGQWYWIELETGLDISGAISRHLKKGA